MTITQAGATASNYVATVYTTGTIIGISGGTSSGLKNNTTPIVITITTPVGGVNFSATANLSPTSIASFSINNAGSHYVIPPQITFVGGGGSGASAVGTVGAGGAIT